MHPAKTGVNPATACVKPATTCVNLTETWSNPGTTCTMFLHPGAGGPCPASHFPPVFLPPLCFPPGSALARVFIFLLRSFLPCALGSAGRRPSTATSLHTSAGWFFSSRGGLALARVSFFPFPPFLCNPVNTCVNCLLPPKTLTCVNPTPTSVNPPNTCALL